MKIINPWFFRKSITITAERLSDNSRITFNISSDKTIEDLRSLLNHHLPPYSPDKFCLYSYQRGALIHFHPPSFTLDYFPVIFDQSVLMLKMDDRIVNNIDANNRKTFNDTIKKSKFSLLENLISSKRRTKTERTSLSSSSSPSKDITCLSLLKQIFNPSSNTPNGILEY